MMFGELKKMPCLRAVAKGFGHRRPAGRNTNNSPAAGGGVGVGQYKKSFLPAACLTAVRAGTAFF